jgi:hypothetical protein
MRGTDETPKGNPRPSGRGGGQSSQSYLALYKLCNLYGVKAVRRGVAHLNL